MARWEGLGGGWEWACLRPPCSSSSLPTSAHPPAPRGKRGWKNFHGILKGMILYLQKVRGQPKGVGLGWLRGFGGLGWDRTVARTTGFIFGTIGIFFPW